MYLSQLHGTQFVFQFILPHLSIPDELSEHPINQNKRKPIISVFFWKNQNPLQYKHVIIFCET